MPDIKRAEVLVRMSPQLLGLVDEARGDVPRNTFIVRSLEGAVHLSKENAEYLQREREALEANLDMKNVTLDDRGALVKKDSAEPAQVVQKNAYHCPHEGCREWSRNPKSDCRTHGDRMV